MEKFTNQLIQNLKNNGFPEKKVAFGIETIYEKCDDQGLSFNSLIPKLNEQGIEVEIQTERIVFSQSLPNNDKIKEAQEMMKNMDPEELKRIQNMFENMSEEEKNNLMQEAKKMGLF